jgi:chitin-binding protein
MSAPTRHGRPWILRVLAVSVTAAVLLTTALAEVASAHGNVVSPASRNYGCWERWGSNFQSPAMATEDPMCNQAWRADPNAMWNWNGLFREGVKGNHQAAIPDGQLCSAGHTQSGRYNSLDAVGDWKAAPIGNNFTVKLFDQASHGADYIRVYVSKPSYNPVTQPLGWGDLDLVSEIPNTPAAQWDKETGGVSISVKASAPGRTGRAIVYTIWQASHLDQSYYFCSDVNFGGSGSTPTPGVTTPPATTPPATTPPPTTPAATTPAPSASSPTPGNPAGGCSATFTVASQWPGSFQANVRVTAGSSAIKGWTVGWSFPNGQQVTQSWGAALTTSGSAVTATNVAYNGILSAGGSTSFGLIASWSGVNDLPVPTCTAT